MRKSGFLMPMEKKINKYISDSQLDEDNIIKYYKKKTREICSKLEEEERIKKKKINFNNNKKFLIINKKNVKNFKLKRARSSFYTDISNKNEIKKGFSQVKKIRAEKLKKIEEPDSVFSLLFPYVDENEFKLEPYKSGADLRNKDRLEIEKIPVIKLNQERRIKSNYNKKFKKYDNDLNSYFESPGIRQSSAYITLEQVRRKELLRSKKFWVSKNDFKRYFGKNSKSKDKINNNNYISDKYNDPSQSFRVVDKKKWITKNNFLI